MKKLWEQPLRRQLFVFILLLLVPVLAAAVWSGFATYRERIIDLNDQTRVTATTIAATLSREVTAMDRLTRNLDGRRMFAGPDPGEPARIVRRIQRERPGLLDLALHVRSGTEVARAVDSRGELSGNWWSEPVFTRGSKVVAPLPPSMSAAPSHWVFAFPLMGVGETIVGAAGFLIGIQELLDTYGSVPLPEGSVVSITGPDGRILGRSTGARQYVGQASLSPSGGTAPNEERGSIDGVRRVFGNVPIDGTPWQLSVGIPVSVALDKTTALWTRTFTVLALGLAGWLVVAVVLSRRLGQSVAHIDAAAQRIASGDFSPLERRPMATHEFAELQEAFDQMVRRFNETRTALDAQMTEERGMREEVQSLQRQVIRQERLAAVGQLVSGVAHEINNPLQAILGFAELLQMQAQLPDDVRSDLKLIQKESARACGIIRNLALFARQQTGEAGPLALGDVITSVAELRQRRLESEDIELRVEDNSKQHVLAALPELQQVLLNFVVNAEQSIVMSGRLPGRITVRTRDEDGQVLLEVEDTGPGIPPENEAKLFQPFYTTKPVGQGTGLGLSVSYGIIDSLDGRIGYRRAPAGGAIFYFELPAAPVAV
jgi:C4-dicarboxylate-specific signal transduction histidine kinase